MGMARTQWRMRMGGVCCLLAPLLAGCQGTWEAFEEIEVGKPVPKAGLFDKSARKGRFEWAWRDPGAIEFPPIAVTSSVRTVHDSQGNVVAKEYDAIALGYWLLVQTGARRSVIVTRVPGHAWHDPPAGWRPPTHDDRDVHQRGQKLTGLLEALSQEMKKPGGSAIIGPDVRDSLEGDRILGIYAYSIARRRVDKRILAQIDEGKTSVTVEVGKDIDFDGIVGGEEVDWSDVPARVYVEKYAPDSVTLFLEITVPAPARPVSNVLEWLDFVVRVQDRRLPQHRPAGWDVASGDCPTILGLIYMCTLFGAIDLRDLGGMPGLFRGVTRKGFDRTYRAASGGTCRIQNLGDRCVRVETNRFELLDGLGLLGCLKIMLMSRTGPSLAGH